MGWESRDEYDVVLAFRVLMTCSERQSMINKNDVF